MKKLIFGGIMAAMLGTGAFYTSQKKQTSELSEIQMANIEALGAEEGGNTIGCYDKLEKKEGKMDAACNPCGSFRYNYQGVGKQTRCKP